VRAEIGPKHAHAATSEATQARSAQETTEAHAAQEVHSADWQASQAHAEETAVESKANKEVAQAQTALRGAEAKAAQEVKAADAEAAQAQTAEKAADVKYAKAEAVATTATSGEKTADVKRGQQETFSSSLFIFLVGVTSAFIFSAVSKHPKMEVYKDKISGLVGRNSGFVGRKNDKVEPLLPKNASGNHVAEPMRGA